MKVRKKPVVAEAIQFINEYNSIYQAIEFVEGIDMSTSIIGANTCVRAVMENGYLFIETLKGGMKAYFGDYIIKDVDGEVYPCKPDIFKKTYEVLEDDHSM